MEFLILVLLIMASFSGRKDFHVFATTRGAGEGGEPVLHLQEQLGREPVLWEQEQLGGESVLHPQDQLEFRGRLDSLGTDDPSVRQVCCGNLS